MFNIGVGAGIGSQEIDRGYTKEWSDERPDI